MLTERARRVEPSLAMSVVTASYIPASDPNEKREGRQDAAPGALSSFPKQGGNFSRDPRSDSQPDSNKIGQRSHNIVGAWTLWRSVVPLGCEGWEGWEG
jgi:hypothetical protein